MKGQQNQDREKRKGKEERIEFYINFVKACHQCTQTCVFIHTERGFATEGMMRKCVFILSTIFHYVF